MSSDEQADWQDVPLAEFSKEALERQTQVNLLSSLRLMKMTTRQLIPDFAGLMTFARSKLRYFDDDIEHPDPLTV